MKKENLRTMMSLLIIGIMFISVLSYAFLNILAGTSQQTELKEYVLKANVSEQLRQTYMSNGFTFMEIHYNEDTDMLSLESMPNQFTTPSNKIQLIIIETYDSERQYATAESMNGYNEFNITSINEAAKGVCEVLVFPPLDCLTDVINMTFANSVSYNETQANSSTNETNQSSGLSGATVSVNETNGSI